MDVKALENEIAQLRFELESKASNRDEQILPTTYAKSGGSKAVKAPVKAELRTRRILRGHFGKVYAMQWGPDSRRIVSAAQDGKLIIWDAYSTMKEHAIALRSSYMMTAAYSPSGRFVATGGLDNIATLYKLPDDGKRVPVQSNLRPHAELSMHEGYLSCARFTSGDDEMLTSSGDQTCILWDVETRAPKSIFTGHTGDVMSVSLVDGNNTFASCSVDTTVKVWDARANGNQKICTFMGHESDVNAVQFMPDGQSLVTGSDDSTVRLFDMRSRGELAKYAHEKMLAGVSSVALSQSGRTIFVGYDGFSCIAWNTLDGSMGQHIEAHENRVSSLGVSPDGKALCTASWDTTLRIWA